MTQPGAAHQGSGTGSSKVNVRDMQITKYVDRATPMLMKYCCKGKFFEKAILYVRKSGDTSVEYVKLELQKGLISSVNSAGMDDQDRLLETVTLNFKAFRMEYTPQKDGKAGAIVPAGWDISKNAEA
jgi:type VI secretion system secreted protein Hcp